MNELVKQLCALRKYKAHPEQAGLYLAPDGTHVFFYFTELLTQEYISSILGHLAPDVQAVILCHKQKKMRIPLDLLPNVSIFQTQTLSQLLIPNKFCPRFERLVGAELEQMKRHESSLPILLASDPMARLYGFRTGEIVKIYRLDGSMYFRRVIS